MSNTTSSTISLDEFFALSRDTRATIARRAIVRRGFRPVVIRRATVARVALVVVVIIANVRNARISPSRAKDSRPRSSVFVCRRAIDASGILCAGTCPTVSSSRVVTRR